MRFSEWIVANGENLQFVLFFVLLFVLATAERWFPRRRGPMNRAIRWPANYFLTVVNIAAMGLLPISFIGAAMWAGRRGWGLLNIAELPVATLVIGTVLVRAFISFFTHYLNHMVPLFWRVHRVHHLDTELDVSTTVRFHPLEFFIGLLPGVPIVVLFGLTPWVLVLYEVLDAVVNIWSHSNVRVPHAVDRVLRYVVVTPDLHRIHHSAWKPETNSNFGAVFPIWDMVFGTFRVTPRDGHEQMRLGLDEIRGRDAHRPLWLLTSVLDSRLGPRPRSDVESTQRNRQRRQCESRHEGGRFGKYLINSDRHGRVADNAGRRLPAVQVQSHSPDTSGRSATGLSLHVQE